MASHANLTRFPKLMDRFDISLSHVVRSQVSGTAFSVYNFDVLELSTLQPMYRDQLLALWRRYVVLGVTVETKIVNKSATVDLEVLRYHGSGTTVASLTFSQALEYKHTQRVMVTSTGNSKTVTLKQTVWLNNYLPNGYARDSDFWGTSADKPIFCTTGGDGYQHATAFYTADGTSTMSATMDRRIIFHVSFFELAAISNSLSIPPGERPVLAVLNEMEVIQTKPPDRAIPLNHRQGLVRY